MPQKYYLPDTDEGIAQMLSSFDDNIPPLVTKYSLSSGDVLRIKQARMAWRYFLDLVTESQQWSESVVAKKDHMRDGPVGGAQAMPAGPMIPAVPTIDLGLGLQPIKWEPGFFVFFGNLVGGMKMNPAYLKADGDLLGIEGAEIPPPDPAIVPTLKLTYAAGGLPQLEVPKGVFQGFEFWYKLGDGPEQPGGFSTTRRYIHQIALPVPGQSVLVTYRAQYRYKGAPFGQKSLPVSLALHH